MAQLNISVADALVRIKTTKERIETARAATFINVRQQGRVSGFVSAAAFEAQARSALDSIIALTRNYAALKSAVVESNARTQVQIGKETMTVAAAIERKTSIEQERDLINLWTQQLTTAQRTVDQANTRVQEQAEKQAVAFFGQNVDKSADAYTTFVNAYVAQNSAHLVDPLGLEARLRQLSETVQDFLANVDLALTTSNVRTEIVVDLV